MSGSTFDGNESDNAGGGIHSSNGTIAVDHSTFTGNTVPFGSGGGVFSDGGTTTLTNCTVSGNSDGGLSSYYGTPPR